MILRARVVLPVTRPPINNGAISVSGNCITQVGPFSEVSRTCTGPIVDLGESILLPGFVNAHCHLDYTSMAGQIAPPGSFPDWIKAILALKAQWSYSEYAGSWIAGARMLLESGVTAVADIEAVPELLPDAWASTPLRVFSFLEITGIKSQHAPGRLLDEAVRKIESLPSPGKNRASLSPHAPYSTAPELLRLSSEILTRRGWRGTMHLAESAEEFDMFLKRSGKLFDWLRPQRDMSDCGGVSPVQHVARSGLISPHFIGVHLNYLMEGDADLLAHSHVVHCPRSHSYFGHKPFPREALERAGANLCLGTDSLVSTRSDRGQRPVLNMFEEMRAFVSAHSGVPPSDVLKMCTLNGARALGLNSGRLESGAPADLIVLPHAGPQEQATEAVLAHPRAVAASMIDGRWVLPPKALAHARTTH